MIPQYGELNRIYKELINNHSFSFDKQKFITEFFRQHNDIETAILKFVLNTPKEQYTLVLKSLKKEIEENILIYETHPLLNDTYEKAPEILKVHNSVIGTLGNFSASIGKAKSKKTFNVSAIVVYDINSPSEATCIISKLMQWTDERQIHIHTILHQNKADENARGISVRD